MSPDRERRLILVRAVVQLVNVLDFVMPLGPDFACELDIPLSHLGIIGGSYTAAAAQMLGTAGEGGPVRRGEDRGPVPPLVGMEWVAWIAIVSMLVLPWIGRAVERGVAPRPSA